MQSALPQTASTEIFNQVTDLGGEDVAALRQAKFRLEGLFRRTRSDVVAALALLHANIKLGERQDADLLADELWGRRRGMAMTERLAFVQALSWLGRAECALELIDDRQFQSTPLATNIRQAVAAHAFLTRWDPEMLRADAQVHPDWLIEIEACGLLPHMRERQSVINAMILPVQCSERLLFCPDGEDTLSLMRLVYVSIDYRARRELAGQISTALESFYQKISIDPAYASSLLSEVILPVTALPSQEADQARHAA